MSEIKVVYDGIAIMFPSISAAQRFERELRAEIQVAIRKQQQDRYLNKLDVLRIMREYRPGKEVGIAGKVWTRLYFIAREFDTFNVECTDCGKHVKDCCSTNARKCGGWSTDRYRIDAASLVENRDVILEYRGSNVGEGTRVAFRALIDAMTASTA